MSEQNVVEQPKLKAKAPQWPRDPVAYLLGKGWECEGDPYHPGSLWVDPTKPKTCREEKRVIGTRTLPNNKTEQVEQVFVTPAAFGMRINEAVAEQLRRERQG